VQQLVTPIKVLGAEAWRNVIVCVTPRPLTPYPDGTVTALLRHCYGTAPMGIAMPMGVIP
jgi:hypothetical protein